MMRRNLLLLCVLMLVGGGCATTPKADDPEVNEEPAVGISQVLPDGQESGDSQWGPWTVGRAVIVLGGVMLCLHIDLC